MNSLKDLQPHDHAKKETDPETKLWWRLDEADKRRFLECAKYVMEKHKVELEKLAHK